MDGAELSSLAIVSGSASFTVSRSINSTLRPLAPAPTALQICLSSSTLLSDKTWGRGRPNLSP